MYPKRDFRTLISGHDPGYDAIRAISREPFSELLKYWKQTGKPDSVKKIYEQGIKEAVAKDRYTCDSLDKVVDYSEFYSVVCHGLRDLWCRLHFRLIFETPDSPSLTIDSKYHSDDRELTQFTTEQKLIILTWQKYRTSIPIIIDDVEYKVGVFPSRRAEDVLQRIRWLDEALLNQLLPPSSAQEHCG